MHGICGSENAGFIMLEAELDGALGAVDGLAPLASLLLFYFFLLYWYSLDVLIHHRVLESVQLVRRAATILLQHAQQIIESSRLFASFGPLLGCTAEKLGEQLLEQDEADDEEDDDLQAVDDLERGFLNIIAFRHRYLLRLLGERT